LAALQKRQLEVHASSLTYQEREAILLELADIHQFKLNQPFEAIEYLSLYLEGNAQDIEMIVRLADLFESQAIWAKQIEMLEAAARLTMDPLTRTDYLLRVARTYEEELEIPDRAIQTYEQISKEQPYNKSVLEALQRLYRNHQRLAQLIEVLQRLVDLEIHIPSRARPLLVQLALALEEKGQLEEALEVLLQARRAGVPELGIDEVLSRILVKLGRPEQAIEFFQEHVNIAIQMQWAPQKIATLFIHLARLHIYHGANTTAGRHCLEQALVHRPEHVEALQELAAFFLHEEAWSNYIEVLIRLAEMAYSAADEDEFPINPSENLMSAAQMMHEKMGDKERAIDLYNWVLEQDSDYLPAIEALIGLQQKNPEHLENLLKRKIDLLEDPQLKALTLTELGQIQRQLTRSLDESLQCYQQALELRPHLIPAVDALSQLYLSQNDLEAARALLASCVEHLGPSAETGTFFFRLGRICEQMGRDEEAFHYLLEALHLNPQNIIIRIAIGLNRFRMQKWREALRHFQELRDHPDLASTPELGAEAFFAAAQCEENLRHPFRAISYYEATVELDPYHRGANSALADSSIEAKQWKKATEYLQREIARTEDREHQRQRLRLLADIYHQRLDNLTEAAGCYTQLFHELPDEKNIRLEVLPTILSLLQKAGQHTTSAQVAEALSSSLEHEPQKWQMRLIAANEWEASGETAKAIEHYYVVLEMNPWAFPAVQALSRLLEESGQIEKLIELLNIFVATPERQPAAPDAPPSPRAQLLARLGELHFQRGEPEKALSVLHQSLELSENPKLREVLAELYDHPHLSQPPYTEAALKNHHLLLQANPGRVASLKALARDAEKTAPFRAQSYYQVLDVLEALDERGKTFLLRYPLKNLEAEAPYPGVITDIERTTYLSLPQVHQLTDVFTTLWEAAPTLFTKNLAGYGILPEHRVSPLADHNLAKIFSATARVLGLKQTTLYLQPADAAPATEQPANTVQIVGMAPPAILFPEAMMASASIPTLRFLLGRSLELTQPAYIFAAGLERTEFSGLLTSILRAFHPRHMRGRLEVGAHAMEQAARLRRNLPFKVARKLGELFRQQANLHFDSASWRQAVQISANRVGLVLCGDLKTAIKLLIAEDRALEGKPLPEIIKISPGIKDLIQFAMSGHYPNVREKLGLLGEVPKYG
jgi:tetratricopeptide (TPR) repeat protein